MVNSISIGELRAQLSEVVERVHKNSDCCVVTHHGKPKVVMMNIDDYEGLMETIEIMSDKKLVRGLRQAEKEMKAGKGVPLEEVHKRLEIL